VTKEIEAFGNALLVKEDSLKRDEPRAYQRADYWLTGWPTKYYVSLFKFL